MKIPIEQLKFDERGLVPAVVQDARTLQVLTLAYMNAESLKRTIETKETWFWSRSRNTLWHKGETSGHTQSVIDVRVDCDSDALTVLVKPAGPACHTGEQTCFHNELEEAGGMREVDAVNHLGAALDELYALVETRKRDRPAGSYTTYLFDQGLDKILKKVGEESSETIIAAKNEDPEALAREASDLLYHLIVLLVERRVSLEQIRNELVSRRTGGSKQ
ncbi:MAG: phosphoribosyl-AMP cyclohydrolase / phosphoribosyl-ATP pyrophosphohydrolase [Blastocatellia bacterium]|jgi:phosphoribosyl-ATP pyrophosphohydrolase/phosphoribosyl-AMP cyclohydrolase|nr:phosphoribosyl-AMP cyclohydrolase / phosphoribosyl-ATP pyrophosphohydrolase [Blastocatellia bacterium]